MRLSETHADANTTGTWAAAPSPSSKTTQPLPRVYALVQEGRTDDALDLIFELVDELLSARRFETCDRILRRIDLDRMDTDTLIGVLSVTYPAKDRLRSRDWLVESVEAHLGARLPAQDVEALLAGLR